MRPGTAGESFEGRYKAAALGEGSGRYCWTEPASMAPT